MICYSHHAIFLATLLVLGETIATLSPSAQALPYYEDNRYDPAYPSEYTNNNSYEPEISYTQDYNKPEYQSYVDNNYYKPKFLIPTK